MILVYASEDAMNVLKYNHALPRQLEVSDTDKLSKAKLTVQQTFVKFDNKAFGSEFQGSEDSQTVNGDYQNLADDTLPVGLSSPGKRKYDESSIVNQDSNPYARVNVTARELRNNGGSEAEASSTQQGASFSAMSGVEQQSQNHEVLMGVDPSMLDNTNYETPRATQEMQERTGMPMLSRVSSGQSQTNALDSMDLIMEDDAVAVESPAVKRVEFAD